MDTYNGWSNYATWRINLEMLDGFEADSNMPVDDVSDMADYLQEYCISLIEESTSDGLAKDYAFAFMSDIICLRKVATFRTKITPLFPCINIKFSTVTMAAKPTQVI